VSFSNNQFALFNSSNQVRTAQANVSCTGNGVRATTGDTNRCVSCNPIPQCRDGNDNDGDGYADNRDPACHSDGDTTDDPGDPGVSGCTNCSYTPNHNNEGGNPPPTVSANPTVIRQGGQTTITWNPRGYPDCTISPMSMFTTPPNLNTSGSALVTLTTETQVTITCGNLSNSVNIRVIPNIFET
jgi:hypothetical protein